MLENIFLNTWSHISISEDSNIRESVSENYLSPIIWN